MDKPYVYQSKFGKWLTGAVALLALVGIASLASGGVITVIRYLPIPVLAVTLMWAAYWHPAVVVEDSGVELRNVLRTIKLPWPSIQRVDTKWALTLYTAYGKFTAWAAPSAGVTATRHASATDLQGLPDSTYAAGRSIRPGDLPSTPSGHAGLVVRQRWDALRDAGYLDHPVLEHDKPEVQWHTWTLIVIALLAIAAVAGIVL